MYFYLIRLCVGQHHIHQIVQTSVFTHQKINSVVLKVLLLSTGAQV